MELIVTGAGGFSGSQLVSALLTRGHNVTAVTGRTRGRLDPALDRNPSLHVISGNLCEALSLPKRVDAIVHAAARSPAPGITDADMVRDNVDATARLISYAQESGALTFIYLSTLSIYGDISGPVVDETTPIINPNLYGVTKYKGEVMLRTTSFRSLAIRLPGVIGPGSVRNWLTSVLETAKIGHPITLYNPDAPFNNAIHINDLFTFIADVLERPGWGGHDSITIGAGGMTTVRDTVGTIIQTLGSRSPIEVRASLSPGFTISSERARQVYGYAPRDIDLMLRQFADENRE